MSIRPHVCLSATQWNRSEPNFEMVPCNPRNPKCPISAWLQVPPILHSLSSTYRFDSCPRLPICSPIKFFFSALPQGCMVHIVPWYSPPYFYTWPFFNKIYFFFVESTLGYKGGSLWRILGNNLRFDRCPRPEYVCITEIEKCCASPAGKRRWLHSWK